MINSTPGRKSGQKGKIMDCSKTIDFFAEAERLCDSRDRCEADAANKERCPMIGLCERALIKIRTEDAIKLMETIQKWSNEHPKKTYAQDFFEKFPKAPRCESFNGGYPSACRKSIYAGKCPGEGCEECWNEPMNDEETKGA